MCADLRTCRTGTPTVRKRKPKLLGNSNRLVEPQSFQLLPELGGRLPTKTNQAPTKSVFKFPFQNTARGCCQHNCLKMSENQLWYIAALLQKKHSERPHLEAPNLGGGARGDEPMAADGASAPAVDLCCCHIQSIVSIAIAIMLYHH